MSTLRHYNKKVGAPFMMGEGHDGRPVVTPGFRWQQVLVTHLTYGGGSLRELYVLKCRNEGLSTYWPCKPGMPLGWICSGMPMTYDDIWPQNGFTVHSTCMFCHGLVHGCCMHHSTRLMAAALHGDIFRSMQQETNMFVNDPFERLVRRADYPMVLRSDTAPDHHSYDEVHALWMINGSVTPLLHTHPAAHYGCGLYYCFRCCDMLVRDDTLLLHSHFDSD